MDDDIIKEGEVDGHAVIDIGCCDCVSDRFADEMQVISLQPAQGVCPPLRIANLQSLAARIRTASETWEVVLGVTRQVGCCSICKM